MKNLYLLFLTSIVTAKPACKCIYGQECWPSDSDFQELATRVSQPILYPVPPESACYPPSNPSGNCTDAQVNAHIGSWRSEQPGAMQGSHLETYVFQNGTISACYLNTDLGVPCEQGSVAVIGVDVRSVKDAQTAIKFAASHDLRLSIKNTGHDFLGRSTARGSFMIWTHHLKNITYNDSFIPTGGNETYKAITLGAGVQWYEAYDAAEKNGRIMVGGAGPSVGASGGWVAGGGTSPLSALHGLGVDNVLEFKAILSNGDYVTVNEYEHPDLFWAMRGGGGGTYALVLEATFRTHDPLPLTEIIIVANFATPEIAKSVLTEHTRLHSTLTDLGWGGSGLITGKNLTAIYIAPNVSVADVNTTLQTFIDNTYNLTKDSISIIQPYDSYTGWLKSHYTKESTVLGNVELGSRLISRELTIQDPGKVADHILAVNDTLTFILFAGGAVTRVDPNSTGLNPNWRKAVALYIAEGAWQEGASIAEIQAVRTRIGKIIDILDEVSPDSATYYNEASRYERDFRKSFFGPHYNKLKTIKTKYDSEALFVVPAGVGSEDWDGDVNCPI